MLPKQYISRQMVQKVAQMATHHQIWQHWSWKTSKTGFVFLQIGLPDPRAVVAAAAAQISFFPGMDLNTYRAAVQAGHAPPLIPPFVPPPHFLAMSQDSSLFGGLSFDSHKPGKGPPFIKYAKTVLWAHFDSWCHLKMAHLKAKSPSSWCASALGKYEAVSIDL